MTNDAIGDSVSIEPGTQDHTDFYIGGQWVRPMSTARVDVINPSSLEVAAQITYGSPDDVDAAVAAARGAFDQWSLTSVTDRRDLLRSIHNEYLRRSDDIAYAVSTEMGAPIDFSRSDQTPAGAWHLEGFIDAIDHIDFDVALADDPSFRILRKPIGIAALITPWNWPMNQLVMKVGAAVAAGCTMVVKPAETAPLSALVFCEVMHEAGVPPGVFNLVNGDGAGVGSQLTNHRDVDMISFTGSTRVGIMIAKAAAESGKRVALELGGKSPDLIFADADVDKAVRRTAGLVFENTGQSCNAPTRMLVERAAYDQAVTVAAEFATKTKVSLAANPGSHIGPLASAAQFDKVQELIQAGIDEGARLVAGGTGRPDGRTNGNFVRPTVFADVTADMRIQREEIFGPVLTIMPFDDEEEAISLANDTEYGLAAYVHTASADRAKRLARRLRAGMIQFNESGRAQGSPFGGVKLSGCGYEGGAWGIEEFLETTSLSSVPGYES